MAAGLGRGSPMRHMLSALELSLARMPEEIGEVPKAICMISGHWEADSFAVMTSPAPGMFYDYSGFPPESYKIVYPAPGAPQIARRTADLIAAAGLPVILDAERGYDHGTFAPAYVMYPKADVPVYQVSLQRGYDPAVHLALGRALAPLRDEGVLIVGSGLSYHNLRLFGPGAKVPSAAFDEWLAATMAKTGKSRTQALLAWETAPHARSCHPQEDHLVPLFAAVGAAEDDLASMVYHDVDVFGGVTASSYKFG